MNADKTSIDNEASCAVTEGHTSTTSTMEKVSNPTTQFPTQLNRKNAGCAPAFLFPYHSTNGPFLSSETKTDQNARGSPSPTLEEPTPMNQTAHRYNGVDNCIQPNEDGESTDKGYRPLCSYSSTPTIVGTELLAAPGLQNSESTDDAHYIAMCQGHNGDRAPLLQAGGIYQTLKCLTDVCSEEEEDVEEVEWRVAFAAVAAAAAEASKIPCSLRRGKPVDGKDRIEAGQGSNGVVASCLQGGSSCISISFKVTSIDTNTKTKTKIKAIMYNNMLHLDEERLHLDTTFVDDNHSETDQSRDRDVMASLPSSGAVGASQKHPEEENDNEKENIFQEKHGK